VERYDRSGAQAGCDRPLRYLGLIALRRGEPQRRGPVVR
jgi:hypothetical protein